MATACVADFVRLVQQDLSQPEAGQLSDDELAQVMTAAWKRATSVRSRCRPVK